MKIYQRYRFSNLYKSISIVFFLCFSSMLTAQPAHYKVGTAATAVPFNFFDSKTNELKGVMIDIIRAVAKEANFSIDITSMTFGSMIPAVQTGRVDIISAMAVKSAERAKIVNFTESLFEYGETLVVKADDTTDYTTLAPLRGEVIGVEADTLYARMLINQGGFKEIRTYETLIDIIRDVERGRLKGGIIDRPIISYYLAQGNLGFLKNIRVAHEYQSQIIGEVGLMVNKNNQTLLATLNKAIATLKANGTIAAIFKAWGV